MIDLPRISDVRELRRWFAKRVIFPGSASKRFFEAGRSMSLPHPMSCTHPCCVDSFICSSDACTKGIVLWPKGSRWAALILPITAPFSRGHRSGLELHRLPLADRGSLQKPDAKRQPKSRTQVSQACKPSLGAIKKATRSDLNRMECLKFESRHSCLSGTHAGLREEIAVLRRMKLPKIPLPTKSVHKNHSSS